jgi:cell division protein FtsW
MLWITAVSLTVIGLVMVYSAGSFQGFIKYQDSNHYLLPQLQRIGLGLLAMAACMRLPMRRLERVAPWLLGVALVLLMVVIGMGHKSHGAARWLRLGFMTLQPTDLARYATVVALAWMLKRRPPREHGFVRGFLPPIGLTLVVTLLIFKQPNLSSSALMFVTGIGMLLLAGAPMRWFAPFVAVGALVVTLGFASGHIHAYQLERIQTFVAGMTGGEVDSRGAGYQLQQSKVAIGSGGLLGRGIGGSVQKYLYLPEAHTDFIFSILAEETGILGVSIVIGLFIVFIMRGLRTTVRSSDLFAGLVAGGITLQIAFYAIANLWVATGLAPTTGLPLPFVSYGGSALIANLAAVGLLHRVSAMNGEEEALTRQRWSREAMA